MKKHTPRILAASVLAAALVVPTIANAAASDPAAAVAPSKNVKAVTQNGFAAVQAGKEVYVFNESGQIFHTKGQWHEGELKDLFTIPYGPETIPMVLVSHEKYGLQVFSDLWPKLSKGKEKDTEQAYFCGWIYYTAKTRIDSRTKHHYAIQKGDEVIVYTANDFDNLKKGYHESNRVKGTLRGLLLYDCCAYVVVDNADGKLGIYHPGEKGAEKGGQIELN